MNARLFQRRFVVVTGKGGVGRSTICAALGLAAARSGLQTCILQMNTRDAIGRHFNRSVVGYDPVQLGPDLPLFCSILNPKDALREYGLMKLRFRSLHRVVFENDVMRRLLNMVPGMTEMLLLGKAWHMEAEEADDTGKPRWDLLIVDAPATGHGISLLRLPEVILEAVSVGPMAEDARKMQAMLSDPKRTSLNIVTLPQELATNEALELADMSQRLTGAPVGYLFVNSLLPDLFDDQERQAVASMLQDGDNPLVRSCAESVEHYLHLCAQQRVQLQRLRESSHLPVIELEHHLKELDRDAIEHMAATCVEAMASADRDEHNESAPVPS